MGFFMKDIVPLVAVLATFAGVVCDPRCALAWRCDSAFGSGTPEYRFNPKWRDPLDARAEFLRRGFVELEAAPNLTIEQQRILRNHIEVWSETLSHTQGQIEARQIFDLRLPKDIAEEFAAWVHYVETVVGRPLIGIVMRTENGPRLPQHVHDPRKASATAVVSFGVGGPNYRFDGERRRTPIGRTLLMRDDFEIPHNTPWIWIWQWRAFTALTFAPLSARWGAR